jgi:periplasmic protein TonB
VTLVLPAVASARARNKDGTRWGVALLVALLIHATGAIGLWRWREPVAPISATPPATFIDLEPLPTPPAPEQQPAAAPPEAEPPLDQVVEPPKPIEPPSPVALPKPPPPKPHPHPVVRPPMASPATHEPVRQSIAPQAAPPVAMPTPVPAAPATSSAQHSFSALIAAQLERYKRYPALAQRRGEEGTVLLRFAIDRSGNVVAAQIERSSGHTMLDDEVMALVRRAAPLPAPPADLAGNTVTLVVPVSFSMHAGGG